MFTITSTPSKLKAVKSDRVKQLSSNPNYTPARSLDNFEATSTEWLWWPWIPLNKLSILEGEPDVGKSTITLDIASRVSKGHSFPQTTIKGNYDSRTIDKCSLLNKPSGVLVVGIEDGIEDTVVPRLIATGANLANIYTSGIEVDENSIPIPLTIPEGIHRLEEDIDTSNAKLVIIDPITAFFSDKVKPGDDTSNRKALNYLVDLAERKECAILMIRHHNKSAGMSAKNRGTGSTAIGALVRSVFTAGKFEDNEGNTQYALADVKCNIAPTKDSITYDLKESLTDREVPVVTWGPSVAITADELVQAENSTRQSNSKMQKAAEMLEDILKGGPQLAEAIINSVSSEVGTSKRTVQRASEKLNIYKEEQRSPAGYVTGYWWSLSPSDRQASVGGVTKTAG